MKGARVRRAPESSGCGVGLGGVILQCRLAQAADVGDIVYERLGVVEEGVLGAPVRALALSHHRGSGEVDIDEWEEAINRGLAKRLQQLSEERARAARAAAAEDEEFSAEFLSMARQVFQMIDKDNSGTLVKQEIVEAVSEQSNPVVLFLINCGNENLQYLLVPARLDAAMAAIDTDSDGEITAIEWRVSESEILGRLRRGGGVLVA